jgi:hypothetical protein
MAQRELGTGLPKKVLAKWSQLRRNGDIPTIKERYGAQHEEPENQETSYLEASRRSHTRHLS